MITSPVGSYYLADVVRLTGARRGQVENWVRGGWLKPEGPSSSGPGGTGNYRTFSFRNLVDVALGVRLSQFHVPLRTFFRHTRLQGLRALVPDFSALARKSDKSLAREFAKGLTADDWTEVDRAGVSRDNYLRERVTSWRASISEWTAMLTPATRPADRFFHLTISLDGTGYGVSWSSSREVQVMDAALVVNLGALLGDLEDATGDHWELK